MASKPVPVTITIRPMFGWTDSRAVFGSAQIVGRPTADVLRAEAWRWVDRQWELWPRPDLIGAVTVPHWLRVIRATLLAGRVI